MFSTICPDIFSTKIPTEEIIPSISNHALDLGFDDSNIPVSKEDSNEEIESIPIFKEPYNPVFLSGLSSLTASLKKVIAIRLLHTARSISTYFGFNCMSPHRQELRSSEAVETTANMGEKVISDEEKTVNGDGVSNDDSLETNSTEEEMESKDDMNTVLESESILVLMSKRNATKGIICEQDRFSCIKFYRYFDVPVGKFLRDYLLNQVSSKFFRLRLLHNRIGLNELISFIFMQHSFHQKAKTVIYSHSDVSGSFFVRTSLL